MDPITLIGLSSIIISILAKVLNFYGVGKDVYGIYFLFYMFIILCILILPNDYPKI